MLSRKPREALVSRVPRRREMPALVASTTSSRATTSPSSEPTSSSDAPSPYPAAVSTSVPPASTNATSWSRASCSSVSRPQVSVPSPRRETLSPVLPTARCCMRPTVSGATRPRAQLPIWRGVSLGCVVVSDPWTTSRRSSSASLQGLTEFLPISSSAHLRIFPELFGWGDPGAAFTAVIQIGTELAVLVYFRKDIWRIASTWLRSLVRPEYRGHFDARMGWFIILGSLPIVVLGVLLQGHDRDRLPQPVAGRHDADRDGPGARRRRPRQRRPTR